MSEKNNESEPGTSDDSSLTRLGAQAKRRRDSLYNQNAEDAFERSRQHAVRTSILRWPLSEDPHDDEAQSGSGYEYIKLEGPSSPDEERDVDHYAGLSGPPSGVTCLHCKQHETLIVQHRAREDVIAGQPDLSHAVAMNRPVDEWRATDLYMLLCPGCKGMMQLSAPALAVLRKQSLGVHH